MTDQLAFFQAGTLPYPTTTTGTGTGLTVCRLKGDPALAFLTQTGYDDEIVLIHTDIAGIEYKRHPTPPGEQRIMGLAWDAGKEVIWAAQPSYSPGPRGDVLIAIDPVDGQLVIESEVPDAHPKALAFHEDQLVRCVDTRYQWFDRDGNQTDEVDLGAYMSVVGLSSAVFALAAADSGGNRISIFRDPRSNDGECANPPGTASGTEALAFDTVRDMQYLSQLPTANGGVGAVGTPQHPNTAWDPKPWVERHRVYIANDADQTIYFGYFYEV